MHNFIRFGEVEEERFIILENCIEQYKYSLTKHGYDVKYSCLTPDSHKKNSYTLLLILDKLQACVEEKDFWAKEFMKYKQGVYAEFKPHLVKFI